MAGSHLGLGWVAVTAMKPGARSSDHRWREGGRDTAWVRAAGELDIATAQQLEQALRVAEIRARRVVLNLRELTFTDSSGVHVIVDASNRARQTGRRLVLVRGPSQTDRLFMLTHTSDAVEIIDLDWVEPSVQAPPKLARIDAA